MSDYEVTQAERERDRLIDEKEALRRALDEARASLAAAREEVEFRERARSIALAAGDAVRAECARLREEGARRFNEGVEAAIVDVAGHPWLTPAVRDGMVRSLRALRSPSPAPSPAPTDLCDGCEAWGSDCDGCPHRAPSPKEDAPRCVACDDADRDPHYAGPRCHGTGRSPSTGGRE